MAHSTWSQGSVCPSGQGSAPLGRLDGGDGVDRALELRAGQDPRQVAQRHAPAPACAGRPPGSCRRPGRAPARRPGSASGWLHHVPDQQPVVGAHQRVVGVVDADGALEPPVRRVQAVRVVPVDRRRGRPARAGRAARRRGRCARDRPRPRGRRRTAPSTPAPGPSAARSPRSARRAEHPEQLGHGAARPRAGARAPRRRSTRSKLPSAKGRRVGAAADRRGAGAGRRLAGLRPSRRTSARRPSARRRSRSRATTSAPRR